MTLASDVILFLALLADLTESGTYFSISFVRLATEFAVVNHTGAWLVRRRFECVDIAWLVVLVCHGLLLGSYQNIYPRLTSVPEEAFSSDCCPWYHRLNNRELSLPLKSQTHRFWQACEVLLCGHQSTRQTLVDDCWTYIFRKLRLSCLCNNSATIQALCRCFACHHPTEMAIQWVFPKHLDRYTW